MGEVSIYFLSLYLLILCLVIVRLILKVIKKIKRLDDHRISRLLERLGNQTRDLSNELQEIERKPHTIADQTRMMGEQIRDFGNFLHTSIADSLTNINKNYVSTLKGVFSSSRDEKIHKREIEEIEACFDDLTHMYASRSLDTTKLVQLLSKIDEITDQTIKGDTENRAGLSHRDKLQQETKSVLELNSKFGKMVLSE